MGEILSGNDGQILETESEIDANSMPKCIRNSMANEIGKMVDGQADWDSPGQAH